AGPPGRAAAGPAADRAPGAAQGRPRRAGHRDHDRGRGGRDRAVGGRAVRGPVARRPRRPGAGPLAVGGPGRGQAGPAARFPEITALAGRDGAARLVAAAGLAILLDPAAEAPLAGLAAGPAGLRAGGIVLITGPEGGVSPAETSLFTGAGAVPARLGPSVLRASTAGAVAAAIVL